MVHLLDTPLPYALYRAKEHILMGQEVGSVGTSGEPPFRSPQLPAATRLLVSSGQVGQGMHAPEGAVAECVKQVKTG